MVMAFTYYEEQISRGRYWAVMGNYMHSKCLMTILINYDK